MHITATQKRAIDQYYKELAGYQTHHVKHETAVRSAFQNLLATFAQSANWILIPEQPLTNGKRPDGTLRDSFNLPCGYWEAKDSGDDLDTEIRKKITIGYPISNTIFEDTRRAVLYQGNRRVLDADLSKQNELVEVVDRFFHDQYQLSTDARSGITSDLNREDEPEYIVRLVGKIVTVSVETVKLVGELARDVGQEEWIRIEQAEETKFEGEVEQSI